MEDLGYYTSPGNVKLVFAKKKDGTWDDGRVTEQAMTETLKDIFKNISNIWI